MKKIFLIVMLLSMLFIQWSDDPNISLPVFTGVPVWDLLNATYQADRIFVLSNASWKNIYIQSLNAEGERMWGDKGLFVPLSFVEANPNAAILDDGFGGLIIASQSVISNYRIFATYLQRMDIDGNFFWGERGVRAIEASAFMESAAADGTGGVYLGLTSYFAYYIQRIGPDGGRLWGRNGIKLDVSDISIKRGIRVVGTDSGEGVITVWSEFVHGRLEFYAQKFDRNGHPQWPSPGILVYSGAVQERHRFDAMTDGEGGAIISWADKRYMGYGMDHIFAQHIDGDGNLLWPEDGAYVGSGSQKIWTQESFSLYYSWIRDSGGGYVFTWSDDRGLIIQRIDSNGKRTFDMNGVIVDPNYQSKQFYAPMLCAMSEGKFLVVWYLGNHLWVNLYDFNGNPLWQSKKTLVDNRFASIVYSIIPLYDGKNGAVIITKMYVGWIRVETRAFHINEDSSSGYSLTKMENTQKEIDRISRKNRDL